jgi:prevent-host-death family protein
LRELLAMKTMKVAEARRLFAQALDRVVRDNEPLIIVRYREPIAALVPIDRLSVAERAAAMPPRKANRTTRR